MISDSLKTFQVPLQVWYHLENWDNSIHTIIKKVNMESVYGISHRLASFKENNL